MIVVKHWKHFYKYTYKRAYSIWSGIFLFGFIPLYLERLEVVK